MPSCRGQVEDKPRNDTVAHRTNGQKDNQTTSWYFWDTRMVTGTWMVTVEVTGTRMLMGQMTGTVEGDGGSDRGADGEMTRARTVNCGMDRPDSDYSHHLSEQRCTGQVHRGCRPTVYENRLWELHVNTLFNPFTPESDQCQNSPAASQEIWQ